MQLQGSITLYVCFHLLPSNYFHEALFTSMKEVKVYFHESIFTPVNVFVSFH